MLFKLVTVSLLSIASARTLRTSEDPAPVKIEDMAKFVGVSAKSEEASTKGGPVDWPPAGIGDVSRKKPVFKQLPGTQSNVQVARESNCRSIRVPTPMVFYGRWRRWFLRRWQHDMALFFCRSQKSRLNNASPPFLWWNVPSGGQTPQTTRQEIQMAITVCFPHVQNLCLDLGILVQSVLQKRPRRRNNLQKSPPSCLQSTTIYPKRSTHSCVFFFCTFLMCTFFCFVPHSFFLETKNTRTICTLWQSNPTSKRCDLLHSNWIARMHGLQSHHCQCLHCRTTILRTCQRGLPRASGHVARPTKNFTSLPWICQRLVLPRFGRITTIESSLPRSFKMPLLFGFESTSLHWRLLNVCYHI